LPQARDGGEDQADHESRDLLPGVDKGAGSPGDVPTKALELLFSDPTPQERSEQGRIPYPGGPRITPEPIKPKWWGA
ncbi:MAG: hypothetical protein V2B18_17650, partial [Pseudomonadota bacterium]